MPRETCATCRFAESTGTQYRECRRNAPIAKDETNQLGGVIQAHWPMVKDGHWCGEHATVEATLVVATPKPSVGAASGPINESHPATPGGTFTPQEYQRGYAWRGGAKVYCCYGVYCDLGHSADCTLHRVL